MILLHLCSATALLNQNLMSTIFNVVWTGPIKDKESCGMGKIVHIEHCTGKKVNW